jgi:hypothetical protein
MVSLHDDEVHLHAVRVAPARAFRGQLQEPCEYP